MSRLLRWALGGCFALTLALLALTLQRVAERGRFTRAFSSYGSGPEGARGLYLLSAELGWHPQRWSQDLARLPPAAALIALGDCATGLARPISRYERAELTRWIANGGTVFVAGAPHYLPAGFGVEFESDPDCPDAADHAPALAHAKQHAGSADAGAPREAGADTADELQAAFEFSPSETARDAGVASDEAAKRDAAVAAAPAADDDDDDDDQSEEADADAPVWGVPMDAALRGLPIVPFRDPGRLKLSSDATADTLLGAPQHDSGSNTSSLRPLAVAVRYGKGRIVALAAANMLQNAELEDSEGAALFARLLRAYAAGSVLLFDEYHLGMGERRSLMQYLRQLGAMPVVFQLALCALVLLWRAGARFGGIRAKPADTALGTTSFVTALGGLYQGAGDATAAVRLIARAALARIAAHHGVSSVQASVLERSLAERGATHASLAVRSIVAAVSSTRAQALPSVIQGIDLAVATANAASDVKTADPDSTRAGVFGFWPVRRR